MSSKVLHSVVLWSFTVLCTASVSSSTMAQVYDCDKYADRAVRTNRLSHQYYCGFGGPQWSNNRRGHYDWCRKTQYASIIYDVRLRAQLVGACLKATTDCDAYATVALAQNWYNKNYYREGGSTPKCRLGPRWHDDRAGHKIWCLTVGPDQRRNELVGRYKALQGGPGAQCP
jgi:hypothetical protein